MWQILASTWAPLLLLLLVCGGSADAIAQEYGGTYQGEGLELVLDDLGDGSFQGMLESQQDFYLIAAKLASGKVIGTLDSDGELFGFEAILVGGELVLTTATSTYRLRPLSGRADTESRNPRATPQAVPEIHDPSVDRFSGDYQGSINGTPSTLSMVQKEGKLTGEIDASGYRYQLQGAITGARARGSVTDPQTGLGWGFEATMTEGQLSFELVTTDSTTGRAVQTPISFRRTGSSEGSNDLSGAADDGERDARLVGSWSRQEIVSGGGTSIATQLFLHINADGSFSYGAGDTLGGGTDWSGQIGSDGSTEGGQWRTENSIFFVAPYGTSRWTPLASYVLQPGRLMFVFDSGTKELWYKS